MQERYFERRRKKRGEETIKIKTLSACSERERERDRERQREREREREKQNDVPIMFCGPVKVAFFAALCVTRKQFIGRKKISKFLHCELFFKKRNIKCTIFGWVSVVSLNAVGFERYLPFLVTNTDIINDIKL